MTSAVASATVAPLSHDRIAAAFGLPVPVAERLRRLAEARGHVSWHATAPAWLVAELDRLNATFTDPSDTPTDLELQLLGSLAMLADSRGELVLPHAATGNLLQLDSHTVTHAEAWGSWRGSFRVQRVSTAGTPRVSAYRLRPPWPAMGGAR